MYFLWGGGFGIYIFLGGGMSVVSNIKGSRSTDLDAPFVKGSGAVANTVASSE